MLAPRPGGGGHDRGDADHAAPTRGPEKHQRIFQSQAAAIEETKGSDAVALAVRFAIGADVAARRLSSSTARDCVPRARGRRWRCPAHSQIPVAAELMRFITTPRATQAMVKGAGVDLGRFKPTIHVTLWS